MFEGHTAEYLAQPCPPQHFSLDCQRNIISPILLFRRRARRNSGSLMRQFVCSSCCCAFPLVHSHRPKTARLAILPFSLQTAYYPFPLTVSLYSVNYTRDFRRARCERKAFQHRKVYSVVTLILVGTSQEQQWCGRARTVGRHFLL
jgi:hypothetical protein